MSESDNEEPFNPNAEEMEVHHHGHHAGKKNHIYTYRDLFQINPGCY